MKNRSKRFSPKLHVRKGDKVVVIAGSYKGTEGEIKEVLADANRVIIEGVNMVKKHTKPTNDNPGGINELEAPIHASNVMLIDPKSGEPTRIGRKVQDGKIVRYSKKSGEIIK
jgi:large subunit ribosomal protein L24